MSAETEALFAARHTEICTWRFGANAECDCGLADRLRREDIATIRQALIDSGTPASGPHDGGLHPVAQEALEALGRVTNG